MIQPALDDNHHRICYYSFALGGEPAGWFEIEDDGVEIRQCATFEMDGERYDNPFGLRHAEGLVSHYRVGGGPWVANPDPARLFPSSAWPLLLAGLGDALSYDQLVEGSGEVIAGVSLRREGDQVVERKGESVVRRFWLDGDEVVRIDWGGAVSELKPDLPAARAGSPFA